ncbi:tetratricopeptide repeat-containing sensor histidine kinase [Flavobacterium weaverense]|uniref:Histidine kinase domain-containing protein n=1 Tax=Flavobacterium weaverense TaxID=271156 RepID=A0A3L9ZS86_9FLAO|nr:tetratricopeptide repeat-containing sensor histidine kinase [Flavobacterium weaverense]RMA75160.1 hypothetical protein BC961_2517 [Flavobacterium weaverense]
MNSNNKYPLICINVVIILTLLLNSCAKEIPELPKKRDRTTINKYLELGYKSNDNSNFDSSYYYFNKARYTAEIQKDTSIIIHSLSWMAEMQRKQGDYSGSEDTSVEALPFLENNNKYPYGETNLYIGLGNNYLLTFDNKNAIFYLKKAINSKTDELIRCHIINNISLAYTEEGNYQKAVEILLPLIQKKELINNPEHYAYVVDNLGNNYFKLDNAKALPLLNKGLELRKEIKDNWGLLSSYYNLSEYYKKKNPNLSNTYLLLGLEKATILNVIEIRLKFLKSLIEQNTGDDLKSFALAYLHLNDSIQKVRQNSKKQFAKIKYDSKKEKEENINLRTQKIESALQLEKQKNKNLLLYLVVGLITVIGSFIYYFLFQKSKKEKIRISYKTEIRIAKKLHDELANDVYQAMAFTETQDLSTIENKETLLTNLDTIYSRTRNISRENSSIETGVSFVPNLKEMMSGFNTTSLNIIINGLEEVNWLNIDETKKITIYRVIQELLVNMKKHSKSSLVVLTFKKIDDKLQLDYSDNGVGLELDKIILKNGLQNVENRIQAMDGTITFDSKSNKGFKTKIVLPI